MNTLTKVLIALSVGLVSEGVISGEVGAPSHEATNLTVAVAKTGASSSWVYLPLETNATARQMRKFDAKNAELSAKVENILEQRINAKFQNLSEPAL